MPDPSSLFEIEFLYEGEASEQPWGDSLKDLAKKLLIEEGFSQNVNVIFCTNEFIRALNAEHRQIDKVTDVLSFEWHESFLLGEIYIALEQVQKQAPLYGNSYLDELKRVLVHGVLHLCGYDHLKTSDRKRMRTRECEFLGIDLYGEST
ncbi:MAG: rRNA maturation RNase YbeY [Fibrobacter sp.]|jgi:probable rRNA maturation factor|nr:rRNA maturation RNase YbeY [Fibrobacter sp.]